MCPSNQSWPSQAKTHLGLGCPCVEERGRSMSEVLPGLRTGSLPKKWELIPELFQSKAGARKQLKHH